MVYRIAISIIALVSMSGLSHADGTRHFSDIDLTSSLYGKDALADSWLELDGVAKPHQAEFADAAGWHNVSPDIIASKFKWQIINKDNDIGTGIFHYKVYNPTVRDPGAAPLAIILIHGTKARAHSPEFMSEDEKDPMHLFPKIKDFARQAADLQKTSVHVLTFGWTGVEDDADRRAAGQVLADLINTYFYNHRVVTIAHSHGGNAVNHASRSLFNPIALAVHIGTPVIQEGHDFKECKPMNIDLLLNFYSTGDLIQLGGGCNPHKSVCIIAKKTVSYFGDKLSAFGCGVRGLFSSNTVALPLQEQEMQDMAAGAHPGDYTWGVVNMFDPQRKILMTEEEKQKAHIKRIVNIRTQANGCDPDHSILKQYVTSALWNVREQLLNNYAVNDDLDLNIEDLNIDMQRNTVRKKRITLAIRNLSTKQDMAKEEIPYSNKQKEIFRKRYGRDIFSKGNIFSRVYTHLYNAVILNKSVRNYLGNPLMVDAL